MNHGLSAANSASAKNGLRRRDFSAVARSGTANRERPSPAQSRRWRPSRRCRRSGLLKSRKVCRARQARHSSSRSAPSYTGNPDRDGNHRTVLSRPPAAAIGAGVFAEYDNLSAPCACRTAPIPARIRPPRRPRLREAISADRAARRQVSSSVRYAASSIAQVSPQCRNPAAKGGYVEIIDAPQRIHSGVRREFGQNGALRYQLVSTKRPKLS